MNKSYSGSHSIDYDKISKATQFASFAHRNQIRKGTVMPYISHPMSVSIILSNIIDKDKFTAEEYTDIMCAGLLHDVVEDTGYTAKDIEETFGENVSNLVLSNTEDKSKDWKTRKLHTIKGVSKLSYSELLLLFADKYANLLTIWEDYSEQGDGIWKRFNAGKDDQHMYYEQILFEIIWWHKRNKQKPCESLFDAYVDYSATLENVFGEHNSASILELMSSIACY